MRNDFNENEITLIERYDKKLKKNVIKKFPVVGGRLRLFHTDLESDTNNDVAGGVETEVVRYEDGIAVVKARVAVFGNAFSGIGMASKSRDAIIYPAILELAETRAIARALRFAGYGVEYTGAEEMSHLGLKAEPKPVASEVKDEIPDPVPHAEDSKITDKSLEQDKIKQEVWTFVLSEWGALGKEYLSSAMKKFIRNVKEKKPDLTDVQIWKSILSRKEEFKTSFNKIVASTTIDNEDNAVSSDNDYDKKKESIAKKMKAEEPDPGPGKTERRKKADIFMGLPEGVNASAFNATLEAVVKSNSEKSIEEVYDIIIQGPDEFLDMMISFCAENSIDPGFSVSTNVQNDKAEAEKLHEGDPEVDEPDENDVDKKKSYSGFHSKWINLPWKTFNKFIIDNAEQFKQDKSEYDSAVDKFNRLKDNNEAHGMQFPYLFSFKESQVDSDDSILSEPIKKSIDWSTLKSYTSIFPKMCRKVSEVTGVLNPNDDKELETFLDEFDHQMATFEAKNKRQYSE